MPLYASFLSLRLSGSSLFIHAEILPDLLLIGIDCSWAWRRWCLNINQLSWATLSSRALFYGTVPFKKAKICCPDAQGCKLAFYCPTSFQDPKLHHLTVTAAFAPHIPSEPLLVGEYEVQWAPLLCSSVTGVKKLMHSKDLQDCLCIIVPPVFVGVVEVPHEHLHSSDGNKSWQEVHSEM